MLPRTLLRRAPVVRSSLLRRGYATHPSAPDGKSGFGSAGRGLAAGFGIGFVASLGFVVISEWRRSSGPSAVQCESPSAPVKSSSHLASPTDDPLIFDRSIKDTESETFTRQAADNATKTLSGIVGGVKQKVEQAIAQVNHIDGHDVHQPARPQEYDDPKNPMRVRMATWVMALQDHIVQGLEQLESSVPPNAYNDSPTPPKFHRDHWLRPQGGEGSSCVIANGRVFEKAGVNVSVVHGTLPPAAIRQMKADHKSLVTNEADKDKSLPFFAAGISIVLHPWNPHAPTVHLNYRYFEVDPPSTPQSALDTTTPGTTSDQEPLAWWFGGGSDLTPSYLYPEDAEHFHNTLKQAADAHHTAYYPVWKKWCDKYFYIPHRGESRGIGGIFFDDLTSSSEIHTSSSAAGVSGNDEQGKVAVVEQGKSILRQGVEAGEHEFKKIRSKIESILPSIASSSSATPTAPSSTTGTITVKPTGNTTDPSADDIFRLVQTMSSSFLDSYVPIMHRRINAPYTDEERRWQLLRRGRYVEFNLVHDRGTKFGLFTPGARIESILMSLPQTARWEYMSDMGAAGSGTREEELMKVLKAPVEWATV
ncbi:hypothetical protein QFC19_001600 [Naganishia cerealis]|uniref:Uncharacterized protein n=1 Tax=Naganishia cerealis TaxID=610337 RepID=A0ACC2WH38_9TREE|nr:hypothetical protein QFC19_001600 [Naganishia cerealis]